MPIATPADDLIHAPEPHAGWRESYAFEFYDERTGLGMWNSIGKKPFKGYSGCTVGIWGADLLTTVGRDRFKGHTEDHLVQGLRYHCLRPLEEWKLTFEGEMIRHPHALRLDTSALSPGDHAGLQRVAVSFDLTCTANVPAYRYHERKEWSPIFTGHLDATGRTRGTLVIDGRRHEIDGWGIRDRSWGTRDWTWPLLWRFAGVATPDFNMVFWHAKADGGLETTDGFVQIGEERAEVVGYSEELQTDPHPEKPQPRAFALSLHLSNGKTVTLSGEVLQSMPVVFAKGHGETAVRSWNDRSLVQFRLPDGSSAHGSVEFAQRITATHAR